MIKIVFKKIADILLRPFKEHFLFFIIFCALITSAHVLSYFNGDNEMNGIAVIATAMHCIAFSYVVTLLIGVLRPKVARQIAQIIFMLFAAIDFTLNFYCAFYLHSLFDSDVALLIAETDPSEAKEFLSSLVPTWMYFTIAGIFLLLGLLWWFIKRSNLNFNLGKKASLVAMGIICICIAGNLYRWGIWNYGPIAPIYHLSQQDNPGSLRDYFSHPQIIYEDNDELPTNVVLIIGESFTRSHSSIYGYEKLTNPELAKLKDNSLLFCFDSIDAPAPSTIMSLRYTLSTFGLYDETPDQNKKWYEFVSLIEAMKESGYESYWYGNQGRAGKYNGSTRVYSQACDHQCYLKDENTDVDQFDIVLVDSSYQTINKISHQNHNFIIYHMKGSHFNFSMRYPKEFDHFTTNDYSNDPESHRDILSSYDNSILYNDYVVNKIIDLFKDTESIVIYLPDHGQVMYRYSKNPDYYAHGKKEDPENYKYGIDIPFFIYATPEFQQKYPQLMERIKYRQDNPKHWNSDDLPYFIMDLIGVKEINGEDVHPKSILN